MEPVSVLRFDALLGINSTSKVQWILTLDTGIETENNTIPLDARGLQPSRDVLFREHSDNRV